MPASRDAAPRQFGPKEALCLNQVVHLALAAP